jgi:hypothetical protein
MEIMYTTNEKIFIHITQERNFSFKRENSILCRSGKNINEEIFQNVLKLYA